jgi:hypothetical protein
MADLFHAPSGQVVTVPDEQVPDLYQSGEYALPEGPVAVQSPSGKVGMLPPEQALDAFKQGFKYMGPEAVQQIKDQQTYGEGIANQAKAAIGGFASAATFGLSDLAARKLNPQFANEDAKVRAANPGSSLAGNLLGGAAAIAGGGAAAEALGLGGSAAAEATGIGGKLANLGTRIATDAVGGAALGGGQAISEAALGDKDLTAEHLVSQMGVGALFGGATGLGLWGAGEALSPVLEKAQGAITDVRDALGKWSQDANPATSIRNVTAAYDKAFQGIDGISKEMRDFNGPGEGIRENEAQSMLAKTDAEPIRKDLLSRINDAYGTLTDMADQPDKYSSGMIKKAQAVVDDLADDVKKAPDAYSLRVAARDAVKDLGKRSSFGKNIADANSADTAAEIQGIYGSLKDHITNPNLYGAQAARESAIREAESALVNKSWGSQDSDLVKRWRRDFGDPNNKGLGASEGKFQSYSKQVAAGNPAADSKTETLQMMQDALQKYSDTAAESAKNVPGDLDLSKYQQLADHQSTIMDGLKPASETAIGAQKEGLMDLAAQGVNRIPVVGPTLAKGLENPGKALEVLGTFSNISQRVTSSMQNGIRSFLRSSGTTGASVISDDILRTSRFGSGTRGVNDLQKRSMEILKYASDPNALDQKIQEALGPIQDHAPTIVPAMAAKVSGDIQYLSSLVPKDQSTQFGAGPTDREFTASHSERRQFAGAIHGVTDAPGFLKQALKTGMVNQAGLDAVRARNPKIYDQFTSQLMLGLTKTRTPLTRQQKLTVSRLTGAPLSVSMTPAGVASLQASFSGAAPSGSPGGPQKLTSGQINKMDLSKGLTPREPHLGKGP